MRSLLLCLFALSPLGFADDSAVESNLLYERSQVVKAYQAVPGNSLSATLFEWSKQNDFDLLWNVRSKSGNTIDWMITHPVDIEASYHEAVAILLRAYRSSGQNIKFDWTFYKNNVLEIHLEESL